MQAFRLHHLLHGSGRWSEGSERRRLVFELRQPVHDAWNRASESLRSIWQFVRIGWARPTLCSSHCLPVCSFRHLAAFWRSCSGAGVSHVAN